MRAILRRLDGNLLLIFDAVYQRRSVVDAADPYRPDFHFFTFPTTASVAT
jgi:hypothetical protein